MVMTLSFYCLELRLLHAHKYVCEISKFVHTNCIIISNLVTNVKMIAYIGVLNFCTAVTTDDDISS